MVDGLGLSRNRLYATVFGGDEQVGPDVPSLETWTELGVPVELTTHDNWWSNGPVGPCGPDSEMFVWTGDGPPEGTPGTDGRWMELVLVQFGPRRPLTSADLRYLHQTHGLPPELVTELLA